MEWTTACTDWERRIVAGESLIVSPPLFPELADEAWDICSSFVLTDVAGHPTIGQVARPWLRDLVRTIFGAESPEGRRLINEFFFMVSKKNAKSTIAAAIMLTALLMNWRDEAELLILSPTIEVANNSYKPISAFIKADEELSDMLKVQDYHRLVTHKETGAFLKVVAADEATVTGKKASFVFVDELHEFGKKGRASNMLLEATGGLTSRPEGFVIYATTQSEEPPAGVFKEKLAYARRVRDGEKVDRRFLPVIYEFPKAMLEAEAHKDLANAYVTNPNWGASVDKERIEQLFSQAQEAGEQGLKEFFAKHLNVEVGLNLRSDRWSAADFWLAAAIPVFSLEELLERSEVVTVGIDGGGLDDLLGLSVIGREVGTGRWLAWGRGWVHPIALERRKSEESKYRDFIKSGDLVLVERVGQDVEEVVIIVQQVALQSQAETERKADAVIAHGTAQQENTHDYTQELARLEAGRAADAARIAGLQHDIRGAATRNAQLASDAAAYRDLADQHQRLAALAAEGAGLVGELGSLVQKRDAQVSLLRGQVKADRTLLEQLN